jgi:DNA-binding beta-propeller fold protein YncE
MIGINRIAALASLAGVLCAAGCRTAPRPSYTFFPPPPDEPRIQYLTGFSSEAELGGQSKLSQFVLGGQRVERPIWKPYGMAATAGKLYVCDTQPADVTIVDLDKRRVRYLRPEGQEAMRFPVGVAADPEGRRYVADIQRGQVLVYDSQGKMVNVIGKKGEMKPCGIALSDDRLLVTDLTNHCVRVYANKGQQPLFTIPRDPADEKSQLRSPTNIAADKEGRIYVSDTGGFVVQVYDREGNYLRRVGQMGLEPGKFALPKGIGVDREDRVYVVDAATGVVQVFDAQGRTLMYFGEPASKAPLYLPTGLCIDYDNVRYLQKFAAPGFQVEHLIWVANQAGDRKVSVYGFMRKK